MDKSFRQQGTDTQEASSFSVILRFFNSILQWLIGFIQMTEEEQRDAGIYLGDEPYK